MSNEWNANSRIWETPPSLNPAESSSSDKFYGGVSSQYYNAPNHQPIKKEQVYEDSTQQRYKSAPVYQDSTQQHYDRTQVYQNSLQMGTQQQYIREQAHPDLSDVGSKQLYERAQVYQNPSQMGTQHQYERAQIYQSPVQLGTGYSYNPTNQVDNRALQQDKSLVLKAVDNLNQLGGLDIDPALISELSKHIKNDDASDQPSRSEIYSPTFNSPTPSPDRKHSNEEFEVDGKKLVSSKPFYEQFNHYEDDTYNDKNFKKDNFFTDTNRNRSRSSEQKNSSPYERTWTRTPSLSPPPRRNKSQYTHSDDDSSPTQRRSRSPQYSRAHRFENRSNSRQIRSRSPVSRRRSSSLENRKGSKILDPEVMDKVNNLLGMSKVENRKFVDAQQSSNVLLVMNLHSWITDKVLWGAIHKYAREYGTKPPFYIEKATFKLSKEFESHLALIAFTTKTAAEMCMMHTKCELEVTGRQRVKFKMMYYNDNTIIFDALNYKFIGIWRAVLNLRAKQRFRDSPEMTERRRTKERSPRDRSSHKTELEPFKEKTNSERKTKRTDAEKTEVNLSNETKVQMEHENSDLSDSKELSEEKIVLEEKKIDVPESVQIESKKTQPNIIKTNVLIGKMKSYLIKQNKSKPEKNEDDIINKGSILPNTMLDQKSVNKQNILPEEKVNSMNPASIVLNQSVTEKKVQPKIERSSLMNLNQPTPNTSVDKRKEDAKIQPKTEVQRSKSITQTSSDVVSIKIEQDCNIQPASEVLSPSMNKKSSDLTIEHNKKVGKVQPKPDHPILSTNVPTNKLRDVKKDNITVNSTNAESNATEKLLKKCKSSDNMKAGKVETKNVIASQKESNGDTNSATSVSKEIKENTEEKNNKSVKKSDETLSKKKDKSNLSLGESPVENKTTKKRNLQKNVKENSVMINEKTEPSINADSKKKDVTDISKNETDEKLKDSSEVDNLKLQNKKIANSVNHIKTDPDLNLSHKKSESCIKKGKPSKDEEYPMGSSMEKHITKEITKDLKEQDVKKPSKRKLSPKKEQSQTVKVIKKETFDDCLEDAESAREREEEEAELFGKGLDKYRPKNERRRRRSRSRELSEKNNKGGGRNFDRRDGSPFRNGREERFGKRGYRNESNRRSNWEMSGHHDKRRREDDDIDGNEDGYWSKNREFSKPTNSVNPWIHKNPENKVSLSLKELKDPEFLLRVLLQTSIMIQNNQLTMSNPLDSLTPTDKDLIIQTLCEIEATNQVFIYATLGDKTKFNAAEHRVLVEALSNIHMFKAALLPPGSLNMNNEISNFDKNDLDAGTTTENKRDETDVYVSMSYIKPWVTKQQIINYLRNYNLTFDFVRIQPTIQGEPHTNGFIKFKDLGSASQLLKRTNKVLYVGNDKDGIQLGISEVTKKRSKWCCNSCSMRNPTDTLICLKCQKLKEKLRDISVTNDVTNTLALINFKTTTTVVEIKRILTKVAPFLKVNVVAHTDSLSNEVIHFLVELPNSQASIMLKKCIRDNIEEFSHILAGPRVAMSFVMSRNTQKKVYTYEDVPRLAQYSASLYATTEEEKTKFYHHYTTLYTQELVLGNPINVILPEDSMNNAPVQNSGVPNGIDNKQWPIPNVNLFTYDQNSGYYYDHSTGLYYESSSQYFYNMETGKFLQYDAARNTYVLVQSSEISSAPVKTASSLQNTPLPQASGTVAGVTDTVQDPLKPSTSAKESKIHAKKVMKDLEKWSKTVKKQDKKKTTSNAFIDNIDTTQKQSPADVGFDILQKTEISKPNLSTMPRISSLIMEHTVCADEEEEYSFIDWKNFTCNLCHRVFSNAEILNKHSKLSDLHKNNLQQWYISKNLDPNNEEIRKQQYRDRAAERRNKIGGRPDSATQEPAESWLCSTPGCMSYKKSGYDLCFSCERSVKPHGGADLSVGSQLLKKMGWKH